MHKVFNRKGNAMIRKRGILLGVFLVVAGALSLLGGGLMGGEAYALPVAGTLPDGREYVLDATGNPFTLPEGVSAEDIPNGVDVANYVQEFLSKKNKEQFNPDNWQLDDGRYVTRDANGNYVVLPEGKTPDDVPEGVDPNDYAQDPVKYAENNGDTGNAIGDIKDTCAGAGGAQSLGWIVCPTISILSSAAEGLYDSMLEPLLQVDPVLFTGGSGENSSNVTREQGWAIFRDIANGVVIALLLLVIFSQLTGIGIDNYGIKKVLPKIIVAAILVNLSYWICVAFVDLSNILGSGLQQMFDGLASNDNLTLDTSNIDKGGTANLGSGGSTLVSVGVLAALGTVGGVMVWSNPALILTLLISAIGVVISVLFLFILFAVREAAIVMLVVVSPVAIACYMLPNTKNVFNRWMKIFEGLLLVYPVTGLLMGGGNFVARLLLSGGMSNSGAFATFTAMIVGVVPIFFIPSLLRNSFNAMGRVGARITGLGQDFGRRMQGAARNSTAYKNAQMNAFERGIARRAGIRGDGTRIENMNRFQRAIRGGRRNIARASGAYVRNEHMRASDEAFLNGGGMEAGLAGIQASVDKQMMDNAQSMLEYGRLNEAGGLVDPNEDNPEVAAVNTNDVNSLERFHANAIRRYNQAENQAERENVMAQIRAVQNLLSTSDKGRSAVQRNFEDAIRDGNTDGLNMAASHLMSSYGNQYKNANRGAHAMIQDLSTNLDMNTIRNRIGQVERDENGVEHIISSGVYGAMGTDKYTAESLVNADDMALDRLVASINDGSLQGQNLRNIQNTAYEALMKQQAGTLNIKPEIANKLRTEMLRGYVPPVQHNNNQPVPDGHHEIPGGSGIVIPNH